MARPAFTEHPKFMQAGRAANDALAVALVAMGLEDRDLYSIEPHAGRTVDDLTRLLLRAYDAKQSRNVRAA